MAPTAVSQGEPACLTVLWPPLATMWAATMPPASLVHAVRGSTALGGLIWPTQSAYPLATSAPLEATALLLQVGKSFSLFVYDDVIDVTLAWFVHCKSGVVNVAASIYAACKMLLLPF